MRVGPKGEGEPVTRTLFRGGRVFDGTMAPVTEADVVVEDGRIVEVGPGLDGDERVDCTGQTLLPGLFDTHTHVIFSTLDWVEELVTPFSLQVLRRDAEPRGDARDRASPRSAMRPAPTPASRRRSTRG